MFTKVRVRSGAQEAVVVVPERAVQELQGRHMVGVLGPDGRVEIRTVKLGRLLDHSYVVEKGLEQGEKIIVEGLQNVQPGAKVNAQEEQPPQATAALEREP
jgi:membrane fusion protein (multidrug efflux system)